MFSVNKDGKNKIDILHIYNKNTTTRIIVQINCPKSYRFMKVRRNSAVTAEFLSLLRATLSN
jgi:hypothetical protein